MNHDKRHFSVGIQSINLTELRLNGRVLDVGGGGEGIIGQLLGENVIAIDNRSEELKESAEGPLKIIMDAGELKFLDKTFNGVTSFFTLMYIEKQNHKKVFKEIYRVLKDEGEFIIWDVIIPQYPGGTKDIFLVPLEIELKDKKITTTYGVLWKHAEQDMGYYIRLAEKVGFEVIEKEEINEIFCIKFKKKLEKKRYD